MSAMGLKLKDILNVITDIVPLGSVVKTLGKGVGALLTKKVAKATGIDISDVEKVLVKTNEEIENDHEIRKMLIEDARADRQHQLDFFGKFGDLDSGSQKLRARVRPFLSFGLVGLFMAYGIVGLLHQVFPYVMGLEFMPEPSTALIKVTLYVVGFWFGGRTVEKVFSRIYEDNK